MADKNYIVLFALLAFHVNGYGQCENPCPPGTTVFLHFPWDNFCADDTAMLFMTWNGNIVPDSFYWRLEDGSGFPLDTVSPTDNDTIFIVGAAQVYIFGFIVDTSGCCVVSNGWYSPLPYVPQFEAVIDPSHCNEPTGNIFLSVLPGGLPGDVITYLWSDGSTNPFLLNVPAGTYTVSVIRENVNSVECPAEYTFTVPLIDTLHLEATIQMDNSCLLDNGAIDLSVEYAGLDYTYLWSNGNETEDLTNLPPGEYTVTVTGPSPCEAIATYTIEDESAPIELVLVDITPTYCDLAVGGADITVTGGAEPITYEWSNFESTQDAYELASGTHTVTVTGAGDCSAVLEVEIPNYDSLFSLTATITPNTSCIAPNGAINLHPQPEGFYEYEWPNSTEEDISNLPGGSYPLEMHVGTCVLHDTFIVPELINPPVLSAVTSETVCGDSTGSIDLTITNGLLPFTYRWSDGNIDQDRVNLGFGFYSVTVTDNNGCMAVDTFAIQTENPGFTLSAVISPNTGCSIPTGSIALSVTPMDTFSFNWSTGDTTKSIDALPGSQYMVTVTKDHLCQYVYAFFVQDSLPAPDTTYSVRSSCNQLAVGFDTIALVGIDGCDSIVFMTTIFESLDTTFHIGHVCDTSDIGMVVDQLISYQGCDSIVVTDYVFSGADTTRWLATTCDPGSAGPEYQVYTNAFGCDSVVETTFVLSLSDTTYVQETTCDATEAGIFYINWSNIFGCDSIIQESVTLLPSQHIFTSGTTCKTAEAGITVDTLINQFGCDSVVTHTVTLLPGDTTFTTAQTCFADDVGITAIVLQNQQGCDSVIVIHTELYLLPQVQLNIISDYHGYPVSCYGEHDGSLQAQASGTGPFDFIWSTGQTSTALTSIAAGNYAVTVTDGNGCQLISSIEVTEPGPFILGFEIAHPACFEIDNGSIRVIPNGGVAPFVFSIDGTSFVESPVFEDLGSGLYTIQAMDANNCITTETLLINTPLPVTVDLGEDQFISLSDSAFITAVLNIPAAQLASIEWAGNGITPCTNCLMQVVAPVITTSYSVTIHNVAGCTAADSMNVFVEKEAAVFIPNVFSPNNDLVNDQLLISATSDLIQIERFSIYDRWGNLVFLQSMFPPNDITYAWDGTFNGKPLDPGVFAYMIIYHTRSEQKIHFGDVTIIR